jgi:hypothetical protein
MPTREEVAEAGRYHEEAYGLTTLFSNISLESGRSWTEPNAKYRVTITLYTKRK